IYTVKAALKPNGWDVQVCYSCAGGPREARLVSAKAMARPPQKSGPSRAADAAGPDRLRRDERRASPVRVPGNPRFRQGSRGPAEATAPRCQHSDAEQLHGRGEREVPD